MQWSLSLLSALPCWFKPAVINGPAKKLLTQIGAKKRLGKDARMFFSLIYLFVPFSIFYIPNNYVIPQAMSHAIPQTHSAFYRHRAQLPVWTYGWDLPMLFHLSYLGQAGDSGWRWWLF